MKLAKYIAVFKITGLTELEYRSSLALMMFSGFFTFVLQMALFRHLYVGREIVGGLSYNEILSFVVIGIVVRSCLMLWQVVFRTSDEVREGLFRRYLIQPIGFARFFYAKGVGASIFRWLMFSVALTSVAFLYPNLVIFRHDYSLVRFLGAFLIAAILLWQIYLTIIYATIWFGEARFLAIALNIGMGVISGSLIPLAWLPTWFLPIIERTPFPYFGNFLVRVAMGKTEIAAYWHGIVVLFAWLAAMLLMNFVLQKKGFKRYEAFGG